MLPVLTAAQMRELDAKTISEVGLPGAVLMETAGRAVAEVVTGLVAAGDRVALVCGSGNNGGDGFVAARVLRARGVAAEVFLVVDREGLRGDALLHALAFEKSGGRTTSTMNPTGVHALDFALRAATVIVDAVFGTGLDRKVSGHCRHVLQQMNMSSAKVVSVDVPSGVRADDGAVLGAAVTADHTVSMGSAKLCNVSAPGFAFNGTLHIAEIGIPEGLIRTAATVGVLEVEDVIAAFAEDPQNVHKGMRGHVLAIAGSEGKRGAGRLVGLAALRGGAGLVTVAGPSRDEGVADPLMTAAIRSVDELKNHWRGKNALVVGPGMATDAAGKELVEYLLTQAPCSVVIDADALNHIGRDLELVRQASYPVVMTPHPGEAARLLGMTTVEIQKDRVAAVRRLASETGAIVVLKGARTLVCDSEDDGFVAINPTGGAELATAGTGDVLAGLIGALIARSVPARRAVQAAVMWHGEAGRLARESVGQGVIATDVVATIPAARLCV